MSASRGATAALALLALSCTPAPQAGTPAPAPTPGAVQVRLVSDEADAALAIALGRRADRTTDAGWDRLLASEGYRRLKQRESAMGRAFTDSAFRAFALSDSMAARAPALSATLEEWKHADLSAAARRALAYLPAGARLRATLYPMVKPRTNSFVFDVGTDSAAIFVYLDPEVTRAKLENTLAHELHHVGYAAACSDSPDSALPLPTRTAVQWLGAFSEGLAVLAAAGGPDAHPHAVSSEEERARWERDFARWPEDLRRLESFFLDVVEGRLTDPDSVTRVARSFYGDAQGPWYTVGYAMASTVERAYGRPALIGAVCDPRRLLALYNQAAAERNRARGEHLPLWSGSLVARLGPVP